MLVLTARNTSSWSTGQERSCRNAVRVQDWASLSFWLISGSKNSATSTAQRLGVNYVAICTLWLFNTRCWPTEKDSRGRYRFVASSCTMWETLYRLVCWQMTLSDCLKYQNGHSSTHRHTHPDSVLLGAQPASPRLASPCLASPNKQQLSAVGCHVGLKDWSWCTTVSVCVNCPCMC